MSNTHRAKFLQLKNRVRVKISQEPGMTAVEIGKRVGMHSPSTLGLMLRELREEGKVRSLPDPDTLHFRLLWFPE